MYVELAEWETDCVRVPDSPRDAVSERDPVVPVRLISVSVTTAVLVLIVLDTEGRDIDLDCDILCVDDDVLVPTKDDVGLTVRRNDAEYRLSDCVRVVSDDGVEVLVCLCSLFDFDFVWDKVGDPDMMFVSDEERESEVLRVDGNDGAVDGEGDGEATVMDEVRETVELTVCVIDRG